MGNLTKVEQNHRLKCNALFLKGRGATVRAGASGSASSTARISLALVMSGKAVAYHLYTNSMRISENELKPS